MDADEKFAVTEKLVEQIAHYFPKGFVRTSRPSPDNLWLHIGNHDASIRADGKVTGSGTDMTHWWSIRRRWVIGKQST